MVSDLCLFVTGTRSAAVRPAQRYLRTALFVIGQRLAHGAEEIERFSPGLELVVRSTLQAAVEKADAPVHAGAKELIVGGAAVAINGCDVCDLYHPLTWSTSSNG